MQLPPDLLSDLLAALPLSDPIEVVGVGASALPTSGAPPYAPLVDQGLARLTGFEPIPAELAKLPADARRRYLPHVVGDGDPATLNLTRHPGFTSLLAPDPALASHIHSFSALTEVIARQPVRTVRLDVLSEIPRIDLLKIDIQGGELAAFRAAACKLSAALCVQTEVAFVPIYRDQPLFADQDACLRDLGLRFFGFASANRFPFAGTPNELYFTARRRDIGPWIDADAVYLADFTRWEALPSPDLIRLFLIVTLCFPALGATLRLAGLLAARGLLPDRIARRLIDAAGPKPG